MKLTSQRVQFRNNHLIDLSRMNLGRTATSQAIDISVIRTRTMRKLLNVMNDVLEALYNEAD